jgi:signal transduction histidine kinase
MAGDRARGGSRGFGMARPDPPRSPGDLHALGQRALNVFAVRVVLLFLGTAVIAVPLVGVRDSRPQAVAAVSAICVCGWVVVWGVLSRSAVAGPVAGLALMAVALAAVLTLLPAHTDPHVFEVAAWIVDGVGTGVAAARGPVWGAWTFALAASVMVGVATQQGGAVPVALLLGPLTYCIGGAAICVAARRGFETTQRAVDAVNAAQAAHRVADQRWRARRAADRELHDTVLATLTMLSHGGVGVQPERLIARCIQDLAVLQGGSERDADDAGDAVSDQTPRVAVVRTTAWLRSIVAEASDRDLEVTFHGDERSLDAVAFSSDAAQALRGALVECLANARRHAQVSLTEVAASLSGGYLAVMVLDRGRGFDPAAVPVDRMGLRVSVRERVEEVGGTVALWSRRGQGTTVVLRVPVSVRDMVAGSASVLGRPVDPDNPGSV